MTPWTVARQAPLSMGFPRQKYWSELPFPSPGDLPHPGIEPTSPALVGGIFYHGATREALICRNCHYLPIPLSQPDCPHGYILSLFIVRVKRSQAYLFISFKCLYFSSTLSWNDIHFTFDLLIFRLAILKNSGSKNYERTVIPKITKTHSLVQ